MTTATASRANGGAVRERLGQASSSLLDAVTDLRRDVAATTFPLPLPTVPDAEDRRRRLLDQLDDHLLPRLRELSAPALVVVAGSTGAGKSTLVNSLIGTEVSAAGVLRPTTRRPVLVHHPEDADLLADHPLVEVVDVAAHDAVPRGLVLLDAPDLDSLLASNRETAHRLLEAADLWLFVTTAARYGDALPWSVLDRATERGTSMAMVLNRVPDDALVAVRGDLMSRLRERGMAAVPLFLVPDVGPHEGLLEARAVAPIHRWLTMVAGPDRARSVIARTQRGSLRALRPWVDGLAEAVQEQVDAREALEAVVRDAVDQPAQEVAAAVHAGEVANGPVRSRWSSWAGKGPLGGRWSRRRHGARAQALAEVADELDSSTRVVLAAAARRGRRAVAEALAVCEVPGAQSLLVALAEGTQHDEAADTGVETEAQAWRTATEALVRTELDAGDRAARRRGARLLRAAGPAGTTTLVAAAAAGLAPAADVLVRALGPMVADTMVARARDDLAERVSAQVRGAVTLALGPLAHDELADDAASRLRLRLAVLKGLT